MNERIKKLRKALDLTQQAFADRLGIKQNTIAKYETNRGTPTTAVMSLIVREFNVNETWLRTGQGEMFDQAEKTTVERLCDELHTSELEAKIIRSYFKIDPRIRESFMQRIIREMQTEYAAPPPTEQTEANADIQAQEQPDIAVELAELKRQNQELAAKVAAMEEEDIANGLWDGLSASPSASVGKFSSGVKK